MKSGADDEDKSYYYEAENLTVLLGSSTFFVYACLSFACVIQFFILNINEITFTYYVLI